MSLSLDHYWHVTDAAYPHFEIIMPTLPMFYPNRVPVPPNEIKRVKPQLGYGRGN
jgi:hypothetical protein